MILVLHGADFSANNIGKIEIPFPLDNDAEVFLNAALSADPSFNYEFYRNPVNSFVIGLKETGIFSKLEYLNMFIGTSKKTHALSIIDPSNQKTFFYDGTENPAEYTNLGYIRSNVWKIMDGETTTYKPFRSDSWAAFLIPESYLTHKNDVSAHCMLGTKKDGTVGIGPCMGTSNGNTSAIAFDGRWNHLGSGWKENDNRSILQNCKSGNIQSLMRKDGVTKGYINGVYSGTLEEDDCTCNSRVIGFDNINSSVNYFNSNGDFLPDENKLQDNSLLPRNCYNQMIAVGYSLTESQVALFNSLVRAFNTSIGRD